MPMWWPEGASCSMIAMGCTDSVSVKILTSAGELTTCVWAPKDVDPTLSW